MAKPDWGALQHQFLAEHAKSGISPKDWCEAQGLNYASAKRYIKIANSGANSQKKMRINLRIRRREKSVSVGLLKRKINAKGAQNPQILQKRNRYVVQGDHRQPIHLSLVISKLSSMGAMAAVCFSPMPSLRMLRL